MPRKHRPIWQEEILSALGFRAITTQEVIEKTRLHAPGASQVMNSLAEQRLVVKEIGPNGEEMWRLPRIHKAHAKPPKNIT